MEVLYGFEEVKRLFSVFLIICMATTAVVADSTLANIVKKGVITVATDMNRCTYAI
jgi:hypothetical protein